MTQHVTERQTAPRLLLFLPLAFALAGCGSDVESTPAATVTVTASASSRPVPTVKPSPSKSKAPKVDNYTLLACNDLSKELTSGRIDIPARWPDVAEKVAKWGHLAGVQDVQTGSQAMSIASSGEAWQWQLAVELTSQACLDSGAIRRD